MIDINKKYTTTSGGDVTLYTTNGKNKAYPIVGEVVYVGGGCQVRRWDRNGKALTSGGDLVEVPIWEPSPELVAVLRPGWIACDEKNGQWWWYSDEPKLVKSDDQPLNSWEWCGSKVSTEISRLGGIRKELLPPVTNQAFIQAFKIGNPTEATE